jgi:hypothetical protein
MARRWLPWLLFLPALTLAGCAADGCGNEILSRHADPGSNLIAYVFTRDCGATTDYATNVAIGRQGENPAEALIVFTADANRGAALQEQGGAIWLRAVWTGPRALSIAFAEKGRVFRKVDAANGATVRFRESGPAEVPPVPDRVRPSD